MPIYEYRCQDCGSQFEALRSMKDADTNIHCDKCSSHKTRRVLSTCYARVDGDSSRSGSSGCASCAGGACSSCDH